MCYLILVSLMPRLLPHSTSFNKAAPVNVVASSTMSVAMIFILEFKLVTLPFLQYKFYIDVLPVYYVAKKQLLVISGWRYFPVSSATTPLLRCSLRWLMSLSVKHETLKSEKIPFKCVQWIIKPVCCLYTCYLGVA